MCLLIPCAAGLDMCVKNIGFKFQSSSHRHTTSVILLPADSYLVWLLLKGAVQVRDLEMGTRELDFHENMCVYIYTPQRLLCSCSILGLCYCSEI